MKKFLLWGLFTLHKKYFVIILLIVPSIVNAQLQVAKIFSDNMVLQRDAPVKFWGKGSPDYKVEVLFAGQKRTAIINPDSSWYVVFKKQNANPRSQLVIISSGKEKLELKNILIGDLWLCIGQSNMEWPMKKEMHYQGALPHSLQPMLRLYNPVYAGKNTFNVSFTDSILQDLTTERFYKGQWQPCDSNSFKTMSAVAWYFGKQIVQAENIPIGLINISIGGAPLETFIDTEVLRKSKQFSQKVNGNWLTNDALPVWVRERGGQNVSGLSNVPKDEHGNNHAFKPGFAYEAGIAPILDLPIKGVLCYQGESNAQEIERVNEYAELSALMVADYRDKWKQPDLPFYFVQLSSIDKLNYKSQLWPQFRDEQRKMLNIIPYSGMAVSSDVGFKNDVHPTNKKVVGQRLARWALNKTYRKNIIPSGPLPLHATYTRGEIIISFQYTGDGLQTSDGKALKGFSIDGKNEIKAIIKNNQIVINVADKPVFVYYGWQPFTNANLVNSELLPASTFSISVE